MVILLVVVLVCAALVAAALGGYALARRHVAPEPGPMIDEAVADAVEAAMVQLSHRAATDRDAAVRVALEHAAVLSREQLGAAASTMTSGVQTELQRLGSLVNQLGTASAQRFGQVDESLRAHAEVAGALADSTRSLREALTNPQTRGRWGERMAEDVLRLAGFTEHVNYRKQRQLDGSNLRPDFTFELPKGHVLHMDVKFPMASYLRFLEVDNDAERQAHLKRFLADVRLRVKELAKREYAAESGRPSVDYVLMFLPNEQLTGFIHEHDPSLLDDALTQRVVMCSPLTLFAFLGVIRQAFDNFMVERTSDEILQLLGKFGQQWQKYSDSTEKVKRHFDSVQREFEQLTGTRRRALERPLQQLEALRIERDLPVDGELFVDPSDDDNVRELGA